MSPTPVQGLIPSSDGELTAAQHSPVVSNRPTHLGQYLTVIQQPRSFPTTLYNRIFQPMPCLDK